MSGSALKLLVATEFPPNAPGGGPAVVRQMLREWPAENLTWWSCGRDSDSRHGRDVRQHRFWQIPARLRPHRRFTGLKAALLEAFWLPGAARNLARMIRDQRPDVIWAIPHDWSILPLSQVLSGGPTAYHVTMQDYVDVHENPRKMGVGRCLRMARAADLLYSGATTRDATSHPMISDLEERTGAPASQMLHAGLESAELKVLTLQNPAPQDEIRIAHAGTILAMAEFEKFITVVRDLRGVIDAPIRLELFGSHSYSHQPWFDPSWMFEHGELPQDELLAKLRDCTWGFSPMRLDDVDPRYNRFSFPTKFITYLAAGLPVIVLAHERSSVADMAARYRVGPLLTASDAGDLRETLLQAFRDPNPRGTYRNEIVRCATNEFDAARMRRVLRECFETCALRTAQAASPNTRR